MAFFEEPKSELVARTRCPKCNDFNLYWDASDMSAHCHYCEHPDTIFREKVLNQKINYYHKMQLHRMKRIK